jgi:chorismate synthase
MPIVAHVALRPTASIGLSQETLHENGKIEQLQIKGRHDPCIGPRALPVVEAMFSLALIDLILGSQPHLLKIVSEV